MKKLYHLKVYQARIKSVLSKLNLKITKKHNRFHKINSIANENLLEIHATLQKHKDY